MSRLLLDVDAGCDDSIALLVALARDDIDLVGVTTVAGNTTIENTTENALAILDFAGSDVPLARGCDRPLDDELVKAEWIHGPKGLPESVRPGLLAPDAEPVDTHAVDFIIERAYEYGTDLTIAAVGPATNLAVALAKEPALPDIVGDIYLMGGALKTTGNVTPMASFNFYVDAVAASRVVRDADPHIVGLDVTEPAYIPMTQLESLRGVSENLDTIVEIFSFTEEEVKEKFGQAGVIASDAVLTAHLAADILGFEQAFVEVDTSYGPSRGATVYDEHGVRNQPPNANVALDIDIETYRETVLSALETFG